MSEANQNPPMGSGVVFLDFDGVILTLRTCVAQGTTWSRATPDPLLCTTLRRICETGIRIVVSSAWRDAEIPTKEKLIEAGLLHHLHADWKTKELRSKQAYSDRPDEVAEWLSRHPEITDYRILDDDSWAWTEAQKPHELKCDPYDGASALTLKALIDWAGVKRPAVLVSLIPEVPTRQNSPILPQTGR